MPYLLRVFLALLLLCRLDAGATEPDSDCTNAASDLQQLTLHRAEACFENHNRELRIAEQAVEAAQADRISAAAAPNPNVFINSSSLNSRNGAGAGSFTDKQIDSVVGVTRLFERGNKRELRTEAARFNAQAARSDFADTQRQQKAALYGAYYDLLAAQEKQRIAEETAESFQKTLQVVTLRLKAGDVSAAEVARISVDALHAQNDTRNAQAERQKAQTLLAYLMGAESAAPQIHAVDAWPSAERLPERVDIDRVIAGRPDVQAAQARVQAAEKNRDLARALRTRDVTGVLQFEHFPGDSSNNTWGVGMSIPLFTGDYYEGEIRHAEADLAAAHENDERVRALAMGEISNSRTDLDAAYERVRRFQDALLKAAQQSADTAEFAYNQGALAVMDLLDARRQLYALRLEAVGAQAEYAKSLAQWHAATAPVEPDAATPDPDPEGRHL